jgi:N-methylhydantoinase A
MSIRVATDVGGTFTDLVGVFVDKESGLQRIIAEKADSTPPNFEVGVLKVLKKSGCSLSEIENFCHGTTVIINALTERKGVRVGLITTKGFRDVLEIARGDRPNYFDLFYKKPQPFVPRYLRKELLERTDYKGNVVIPLDLGPLDEILDEFRKERVEAVAISFLHSYLNPSHEEAVARTIRARYPQIYVSSAHEIAREWREYERTSTTVLSAYVKPIANRYLDNLKTSLKRRGYRGATYVMQSNCGISTLERAREVPITMVESGPASGVWGAAEIGKLLGYRDVIALDIGGTTAKCSLIKDGTVRIVSDYWLERSRTSSGYPLMVPVVDIVEIGNGGGSIAWVDDYGKMHVGPVSAGANPGPVAYGRGGTNITTTDANLYLGRINPNYFCGGEVTSDLPAVERALTELGHKLGMDAKASARGVIRIANHNMTNALKLVSLNRGHDPRDFALIAFGGGGGMHASALARELGIRTVIIPAQAAVFSALGMLLSDVRRDYIETFLSELDESGIERINVKVADTRSRATADFQADGIAESNLHFQVFARLRYRNQEHHVEVPIPASLTPALLEKVNADFESAYEREYTYRLNSPVELVAIHCVMVAKGMAAELTEQHLATGNGRSIGIREVDFDEHGIHPARIFRDDNFPIGEPLLGPIIVEEAGTTLVVFPGDRIHRDRYGNYHIAVAAEGLARR